MDSKHRCHWPGCRAEVAPKYWGCFRHWNMLPKNIQGWICSTYRAGQEQTKNPSREYVKAASAAKRYAINHPDPLFPPFAVGEVITIRAGSIFSGSEYVVKGCELRKAKSPSGLDIQVWWVLCEGGSEWPAGSVVPASLN
jgi:hypothetical protein